MTTSTVTETLDVAEVADVADVADGDRRLEARRPDTTAPSIWTASTVALGLGLMAVAAVARLVAIGRIYDINQDEVNYVDLGLSARHGHFPPLFEGSPFLLHPPLFSFISAGWEDMLSFSGTFFQTITVVRDLNIVFATATVGLLFGIGTVVAGRVCGGLAALLFALDPYVLRQNGRAMLETSTLTWVLAGLLVVLLAYRHSTRHPRTAAVGAGLLFGLGLVTKDLAVLIVIPPLIVAWWRRWGPGREFTAITAVASLVPYGVYVIALAAVGQFGDFISQETLGLRRTLGLVRTTGFNAPGAPSLWRTLVHQIGQFGVTYLLCGIGLACGVSLLWRRRDDVRLLGAVTVAGFVTIVFSVLFGTAEEQFLYFAYVPSLLAMSVVATPYLRRATTGRRFRLRLAALAALALFGLYDVGVWAGVRTTPDNGEQRLVAWFAHHGHGSAPISDDTQVTTYLLQRSGLKAEDASTLRSAAQDHVRYLTVLTHEDVGGYGFLTGGQVRAFERHGRRVFQFHEPTYGTVAIYETTDPRLW